MSWNIYRCSTLEMFAKSEESLGSSSGIGSIKKESNEENPPRLIPTQFNCENWTGEDKCIWYCGNFCISVLTYKSAKQWKFRVLFYRQARKIKKQLSKYRSRARILGSFALTIMTHNCASRIRWSHNLASLIVVVVVVVVAVCSI